jgi:hypothetical protein
VASWTGKRLGPRERIVATAASGESSRESSSSSVVGRFWGGSLDVMKTADRPMIGQL